MRILFTLTLALSLAGCATVRKNWEQLQEGQTKAAVLEAMVHPPDERETVADFEVLGWYAGDYQICIVAIRDDKVRGKECRPDHLFVTPRDRWGLVEAGQDKELLVRIMGRPDSFTKDGGHDILVWNMDRFEKCAVMMGRNGKVEGKSCKDNAEARAQAYAAEQAARAQRDAAFMQMMMMRNQMQPQPAYTPITPYQMKTPQQTNCQTRWVGGTAYTDCNSY